jgi:hypothetical protein
MKLEEAYAGFPYPSIIKTPRHAQSAQFGNPVALASTKTEHRKRRGEKSACTP